MKKNLGSLMALYPTPVTVVGAIVNGKPNWMQIAHVGIMGHDRIMISSKKTHYTNKGIKETGILSVSLADKNMLPKIDLIGSTSGNDTDKSKVFEWYVGENGAPIPEESPLVLVCEVVDNYETDGFDNFILKINATLVEDEKISDDNKPDYEKIAPVLFEYPSYSYFESGKYIGKCLSFKTK